jgi:NAD+ kinase
MKIAIYGKQFSDSYIKKVNEVIQLFLSNNCQLFIHETFHQFLKEKKIFLNDVEIFNNTNLRLPPTNFIVSIGGDGTILETVYFAKNHNVPILGLNTGRLGFLSALSITDHEVIKKVLFDGLFYLDERALLELHTKQNLFGELNYALNEIAIHRKDSSSLITINAYLNDELINSYWADGLIIATPTGSTAYSLSCGGPIISPKAENIVITPLAPHNLNVRPLVISNTAKIKIIVDGRDEQFMVTADSRFKSFSSQEELLIEKANFTIKLVQPLDQTFYKTIRTKLNWGLDKRN